MNLLQRLAWLRNRRAWVWLLAIGICAALVILAASLGTLKLNNEWGEGLWPVLRQPDLPANFFAVVDTLLLVTGLLFFLLYLYVLFTEKPKREPRKNNWSWLPYIIVLLLLLVRRDWLARLLPPSLPEALPASPAPAALEAASTLNTTPAEWFVSGLSLVLAIAFTTGAWWFWRWSRRLKATSEPPVQAQLAETAQAALNALQEGADLSNVIVRCYQNMSEVVAERRGLQRQAYMTPREFLERMQAAGLPPGPVERLTRLFEQVRYGSKVLGAEAEADAWACLQTLASALESARA